jgi:hypothetical protein
MVDMAVEDISGTKASTLTSRPPAGIVTVLVSPVRMTKLVLIAPCDVAELTEASLIALVDKLAAATAFVPMPVPSLKLESFVPKMFHLADDGCSPKTTLQDV